MKIIAKKHSFNIKKTQNRVVLCLVLGIVFLIVSVIQLFRSYSDLFSTMPMVAIAVIGIFLILIALLYSRQIKRIAKIPEELISFDEEAGLLELHLSQGSQVTEQIANLTHVSALPARSRYVTYNFGTLILSFQKRQYKFIFVADVNEVSTMLLILKNSKENKD